MLERLWAGWRNDYVRTIDESADPDLDPQGTLFERILATDNDDEAGIVHRGLLVSVLLNAYPYGSGHVLVLPNRGVEKLSQLDADEVSELWATVQRTVEVIEATYDPPGVNVGLNQGKAAGAGVPEHLHVHVLPRWAGDTNFMTSIAETRVLPETLEQSLERLRAHWHQGQ